MLAFIGGTGIYSIDEIAVVEELVVETPFGNPSSIGMVTDYDCEMDNPEMYVKATEIFALYGQSIGKAINLLQHLMQMPRPVEEVEIRQALAVAILTPDSALPEQQRLWVGVLGR